MRAPRWRGSAAMVSMVSDATRIPAVGVIGTMELTIDAGPAPTAVEHNLELARERAPQSSATSTVRWESDRKPDSLRR